MHNVSQMHQIHRVVAATPSQKRNNLMTADCACCRFDVCYTLVGGNNLVDPAAQVGDAGVHSGSTHIAVRGAPGDDAHKIPRSTVLTHQRTTRVTLKMRTHAVVTRNAVTLEWIIEYTTGYVSCFIIS